jgi:hypothetical protein
VVERRLRGGFFRRAVDWLQRLLLVLRPVTALRSRRPSLTFNYLTSAHEDGRRLNPMVNQRSTNVAATAVKAMPTVTETADANG